MRRAVLLAIVAIAACVPGCQLIFSVEPIIDPIPHVRTEDETIDGALDLTIMEDEILTVDTSDPAVTPIGPEGGAKFDKIGQDGEGAPGLAVMRVDKLVIEGTLLLRGTRPLVVIANRIEVAATGVINASAVGDKIAGAGGGTALVGDGRGGTGEVKLASRSGGGGGGGGPAAGHGGAVVMCIGQNMEGGAAGAELTDEQVSVIFQGGGVGGDGQGQCLDGSRARGGAGGGAVQLSAFEEIVILGDVHANGAGGDGGVHCSLSEDGSGAGGGGGGVIYLDAPIIDHRGILVANGGGGGGGSDRDAFPLNPGPPGADGVVGVNAAQGGAGVPDRGTRGGNGGAISEPSAGATGMCGSLDPLARNTGGGGGAPGRIVIRGTAVDVAGGVSPTPFLLTR